MEIEITYKLALKEIGEFQNQHYRVGPVVRNRFLRLPLPPIVIPILWAMACLSVMVFAMYLVEYKRMFTPTHLFLFLAAVTILPLTWLFIRRLQLQRRLAKALDVVLVASEKELIIKNGTTSQTIAWEQFLKFAELDKCYALYFASNRAIVVPKRAFATEEQSHLFRGLAQSGITKAQGFPVQPKSP